MAASLSRGVRWRVTDFTMLLSLCMIVRNERRHLERCLRSVRGVVDELVVVDTGSDDGSQEIARRAGARSFEFPWVNDFARARNHALEQARAPWILVLDADEQLLERDHAALMSLLRAHTPKDGVPRTAFNLLVNNSSDGGRTGMLAHIVRLFPNHPDIRYEWPVHEQIATSLLRLGIPIKDTRIEILHDGYAEAARNQAKQQRNLAILQKQVAGGGAFALTHFLLGGARLDLGDFSGAMAAYQECIRSATPGDQLIQGAQVRIANCLYAMGRFLEVCAWVQADGGVRRAHPEQSLVLGNSMKALGNISGAREALCGVLAVQDGVFMPPCNLMTVKVEAVLGLATLLKEQGDEKAAVQLMRAAVARSASGQPLDSAWWVSLQGR